MPTVFVHGVATRQTPEYLAIVALRDQLFRKLLVGSAAQIFSPDWGSGAVELGDAEVWLPEADGVEALSAGGREAQGGVLSALAAQSPEAAVDALFVAAIGARIAAGDTSPLSEAELTAFRAAITYLDGGGDPHAFSADASDAQTLDAVTSELQRWTGRRDTEAMGIGDAAFDWLKDGAKAIWDPLANVSSDIILRAVRRPLSAMVALFLGDIFVYLRRRDTLARDTIFGPVGADLARAAALRTDADPLLVVGHSLGGVILCDMLSDPAEVARIEQQAGTPLRIDALITVGSQIGLFADMGLYGQRPPPLLGRPAPASNWINIFDYTDVLSFRAAGAFNDVLDLQFDSRVGLLNAHSSYFLRPRFYQRMRRRLAEAGVLA